MNILSIDLHRDPFSANRAERLRFFILQLFVFSLPFDMFYSAVIFLCFCAVTIVALNRQNVGRVPKQFWIFQLIFLLGVAGYFYSIHKSAAGFLLERQLSIFLFPLLIPIAMEVTRERKEQLLKALTMGSVCATIYLFFSMVYKVAMDTDLPVVSTVFSGAFFNHQFSKPLGIHAGYLSLYLSLSVFYIVEKGYKSSDGRKMIFAFLVLLILFGGLFFLASRNTLIATFFILVFVFPLFNINNKIRFILIAAASVAVAFFILRNIPYLKDRFSIELITEIKPLENGQYINYNSAEPRVERWKGALDLIAASPVYGFGTGDEIPMLKTEYIKRGLYISYIENFNAHNQYLSYLLKNGILGCLIFMGAFIYYCRLAVINRDFIYLSFLFLLLIGFYTENILDANKGVLFFAVFNTFFGYAALRPAKTTPSGQF
jgi:O-antigen ligase